MTKPLPASQTGRQALPEESGLTTSEADPSGPVQSAALFKGQKSVLIEHNGASYRLQTTKLGKLILTK